MHFTLGEMLSKSAIKYGHKTALMDEDKQINYKSLNERANCVANFLRAKGLKKGDRCAILLLNCCEYLELYFGMAKAGIIAVPINFRFTPTEIRHVLNDSEPSALVLGKDFNQFIPILKEHVPSVPIENYICMEDPPDGASLYEELITQASSHPPGEEVAAEDVFFIAYTSGTTGIPKGAVVQHGNLLEHYLLMTREFGNLTENDTALLIMPLFHSNSTWLAQALIMIGGTVFIHPSRHFDPEYMLKLIANHKITGVSVVPTMLTMLFELPEKTRNQYNISSLHMITSSSAPILTKTKQQTIEFFKDIKIFEGYGSTETGVVTVLKPEDQLRKVRSVGEISLLKSIKLLDDQYNEVPTGEVGELFVKGAGILLHKYWRNPEQTNRAFWNDCWVTVGDMATVDDEGYFYLVDRKNDMIISGGENIYPTEVENVISNHPAVQEVAVIGVPDPKWSEKVHAVIVLREGKNFNEKEVREYCLDKIAKYKIPRSVEFVESIPKTLTGKILRREVRNMYGKVQEEEQEV